MRPERRARSGDHTFRLRQMVEWLGDRKGIAARRPSGPDRRGERNRVGLRIGSTLGRFPAVTRYLEVGDQVLELSRVKRPRQLSAAPEQ